MPEPSLFRHYQIVQDADGNTVELMRTGSQVAVLAFDTQHQEFVHCHVLLEPLADKRAFEAACQTVQTRGHPLLSRLPDFGEDDGNPFYITSNVDGETLRSYLERQQELPGWIAIAIACRSLEAVTALVEHAGQLPEDVLTALRIVQTGAQQILIQVADYRLLSTKPGTQTAPKPVFDQEGRRLQTFFQSHSTGSSPLPDQLLPGHDFMESLASCLAAADKKVLQALRELKGILEKHAPEQPTGEIPTVHKPRALMASHFATYQEVARGVVNVVRIQSQRLDMASPYSMRGTLTKTGRNVLVEQILPTRLTGSSARKLNEKALALANRREFPALVSVVLVHEGEGITCLAEEQAEGISLADLLRERRTLSVRETYLVLAALDGALDSLEKSGLETQRLRFEDIFLLTGFPREDARTAKLLLTKLNEWPAFSLMLRAHPTLAAMASRGLDPAVLLPVVKNAVPAREWSAAWLAAVGRFLVGLEALPGLTSPAPEGLREHESLEGLFTEEIQRLRDGKSGSRGDFLARYARIVQHHDLVKPVSAPASEPPLGNKPPAQIFSADRPSGKKNSPEKTSGALTSGLPPVSEKPTIGFAELLFRDTSVTESGTHHDWAKTAADAPPTIHPGEVLLPPNEFVPFWLRAAVFIGGSIVIGAVLSHLSGDAFWLKPQVPRAIPVQESPPAFSVGPPAGSKGKPLEAEPPPGPAAPQVVVPALPLETPVTPGASMLKPPTSTLKDDL